MGRYIGEFLGRFLPYAVGMDRSGSGTFSGGVWGGDNGVSPWSSRVFFKIFIVMGLLKKGLTSFYGHGGVDMYGCTPEERHISRL